MVLQWKWLQLGFKKRKFSLETVLQEELSEKGRENEMRKYLLQGKELVTKDCQKHNSIL